MQTISVHDYPDKEDQIFDWVSNSGSGLMGVRFGEVPEGAIDFAIQQYARFNVPVNALLVEVIRLGISSAIYLVDFFNPYSLLHGVSDVNATDEWASHTFQIFDGIEFGGTSKEADPEVLETFAYVPGQAEEFFNYCLSRPGLDAMPYGIGCSLREILFDLDEEIWDGMTSEVEKELKEACREDLPDGTSVVNKDRMHAYIELAAWAGFLWIAGPLGRAFRMSNHEIMDCAMTYGECILSTGSIIPPTNYRKLPRPPRSCYKCGMQTWCVENTQVDESFTYVCEACLNFDFPKFGGANCGTKFCKLSACIHHPFHYLGSEGMFSAMRQSGQLMAVARGDAITRLQGARTDTPLQLGF